MNIGTLIPLIILIVIVALVIRSMVKDKKAGKSLSCGGNCGSCPMGGSCSSQASPPVEMKKEDTNDVK